MNAPKDEYAAALWGKRLDNSLDLAKGFACMKLRFDVIVASKQFQIGDSFEADNLVTASGVDHQIARDGEKIRSPGRNIFPIFCGIGASHNFSHHVFKFMRARENASQPTAEGRLLRQNDSFKPF